MGEEQRSEVERPTGQTVPLRIWPAVMLLVLLWACRIGAAQQEEFSLAVVAVRLGAPLILAGVIVLWWLLFSRARGREKLLGLTALIIFAVATAWFSHQTVRVFGTLVFAVPWGISAFAVTLVIAGRTRPWVRTPLAILAALLGFGYWGLVRTDTIMGDFDTRQSWRWTPNAEEEFLASLDRERGNSEQPPSAGEPPSPLAEPEWSEFRGPNRNGDQANVVLAEDWEQNPPQELWRIRVGPGWSSFSVAGDRLFTQEQRGDEEVVVCYDAGDGSQRWVHRDDARFWEVVGGPGPRATPTISEGRLYTLGATGILNCLDPLTGAQIWQRDISEDAGRDPPQWGFASSPLATHGLIIVHAGGADDKGTLAYDRETGELRWTAPAGDHSYSSPQLSTVAGKETVLVLSNTGVTLLDPESGAVIGEHQWSFDGYRVVQPLVIDESSILIGTPMGVGTLRANFEWNGTSFESQDRWTSIKMSPYFNDYVAHEGYLYGIDKNIFACLDLETGQRKWKRGRYGNGQVLLLSRGDQLLVTSEEGELVLLRATPEEHQELASYPLFDGRTWNHPVLVNDRLYARNGEEAVCLQMPVASPPRP